MATSIFNGENNEGAKTRQQAKRIGDWRLLIADWAGAMSSASAPDVGPKLLAPQKNAR
jgi:hypothetical protein